MCKGTGGLVCGVCVCVCVVVVVVGALAIFGGSIVCGRMILLCVDQIHKSLHAPDPYPTTHHS